MIKLYCNRCHRFIKELLPNEAGSLKGDEICKDCQNFGREQLDAINVKYHKLADELAQKHNKAVVQIEEMIRKVFEVDR